LRQLVPSATIIGVLNGPDNPRDSDDVAVAARQRGLSGDWPIASPEFNGARRFRLGLLGPLRASSF